MPSNIEARWLYSCRNYINRTWWRAGNLSVSSQEKCTFTTFRMLQRKAGMNRSCGALQTMTPKPIHQHPLMILLLGQMREERCMQPFQSLIELTLLSIPPAVIDNGIGLFFCTDHIVHGASVLEFSAVLPF
jgi:hypothetical protein